MIEALIFDFDGVVVDSEPIHLACFRAVVARRGIALSDAEYYARYVGFDDHDCFAAILAAAGRGPDDGLIAAMTAEKSALVKAAYAAGVPPLPGAVELMAAAAEAGVGVAICSGGLRDEITLAAKAVGALPLVEVLVSAEDVPKGKPDPQGYQLALRLLAERRRRPVRPAATWVIEDAPAGIAAAKAAGCRVLAVTNTYPPAPLAAADRIVETLAGLTPAELG